MKIAICDKDATFSHKLKHILYNYANSHKLEFFIETFTSGEQLLNCESRYPIIFMEYSLLGINGFETAKEIRKRNNTAKIIFLTTNTHFVFEAFKVRAYRFLPKPLCEESLYKALDDLFFYKQIHYPLFINDGLTTYCINTSEITYLEANNKYCYVHLNDTVILCKKTMARVYDALPKLYFLKINRSFIVNLNFINKYNSKSVFLKNGEDLHVTRTYYKDFKENYSLCKSPEII